MHLSQNSVEVACCWNLYVHCMVAWCHVPTWKLTTVVVRPCRLGIVPVLLFVSVYICHIFIFVILLSIHHFLKCRWCFFIVVSDVCVSVRTEAAFVAHIENPCHFVVHLNRDRERLKNLNQTINAYCNLVTNNNEIPSNVEPGNFVLWSLFTFHWYRNLILNILKVATKFKFWS